jgi:hypothetical protein
MKLEYTDKGKFVAETQKLIEELEADAVMLLVFGSRTKGSGACCEMRVNDPARLALIVVQELRALADSIEADVTQGALDKAEVPSDQNGHKQTELKHPARSLRPGQPSPGDHL